MSFGTVGLGEKCVPERAPYTAPAPEPSSVLPIEVTGDVDRGATPMSADPEEGAWADLT